MNHSTGCSKVLAATTALNIKLDDASVAGTFISRNYFAGYLLMVIPLSIGYLLSREENQILRLEGWRHWLTSLHGKSLLVGFGVIVMILSLFFSASRMGITSLLFSCGLISLLIEKPPWRKEGLKNPRLDSCPGLALGRVDRTRCRHQPVFHRL